MDEIKLNSVTSFRAWQAAGKPRSGLFHHEMLVHKMRYRKAIKDKDNQNLLLISNDLHDCLVKKDFTNFWKTWDKKFNIRKNDICVEGLQNDSVIVAEFAKYFESVRSSKLIL